MDALLTLDGLIAFLTLAFLEIVLGIDNIIFISILSNKLPERERSKARTMGILLALVFRIIMLLGITWIIQFTDPIWAEGPGLISEITGRDLVLMIGGLFLLAKSTKEIHKKIQPESETEEQKVKKQVNLGLVSAIVQIALLDIVFSFDSILTAIGMTNEISIMIAAVIVSLIVMLIFAKRIADFIEKHVSLQILALSFLILIGTVLISEGLGVEVPKGYIYFAVAYSLIVELLNMRADKKKARKKALESQE
ncbi:MAG: TerC family protein [Bacteroidetes bacterium]|uniref:TerC family protein n=1 Tax=Phaeocystidibacter marisrubri TaxID=1577780 RepID=A0A6L3ZLB9_9FLAO|nr:TerC family protein [Phaeocystidibacter marisrubri]KAB2817930.1 TerC family protein [Phaeocystidibacter marisrubri]TNE28863.1 MAG: TerC family protein [Bacteroidota bacterium]GGH72816.1 membrane protein [Phaeocystidibacter marisrubri]